MGEDFFFQKNQIFRAKILVEFECKYREVGNRLLLALLCLALGSFDMEIIEKGGAKGVNHFANISSMAFKRM